MNIFQNILKLFLVGSGISTREHGSFDSCATCAWRMLHQSVGLGCQILDPIMTLSQVLLIENSGFL